MVSILYVINNISVNVAETIKWETQNLGHKRKPIKSYFLRTKIDIAIFFKISYWLKLFVK